MPTNPTRCAFVALGLAITLGAIGCSSSADDVVVGPKPAPTAPAAFVVPKKNPAAVLDSATQAKCDKLGAFQLFSYSAHVAPDRTPAAVQELLTGLDKNAAETKALIPELGAALDTLAVDGRAIQSAPVSPGKELPAAVVEANNAVLTYLRNTCKYVD